MTISYDDTGFKFTEIESLDAHPKTSSTFDNDLKILFTELASVNEKNYNEEASHEELLPLIKDVLPNDLGALKDLYLKFTHNYPFSESMLSEEEKNNPCVKRAYFLAQAIREKSTEVNNPDNITGVSKEDSKKTLAYLKSKEQERTELLKKKLKHVLAEEYNYAQCQRVTESLKRLIKEYDEHLQKEKRYNTQDKYLTEKINIVEELKNVFEKNPETANEVLDQLTEFQSILKKNEAALKQCLDTCFEKFLKAVGFILSLLLFWFVDIENLGIFEVNGTRASTFPGFIYNAFTSVKGNYFFKRANLNHDYELDTKSWFCKENTIIVKAENGKLSYVFKSLTTGKLIYERTDINAPTPLTDESVKIYKKDILKLMQASGHLYNLGQLKESILENKDSSSLENNDSSSGTVNCIS